MTQDCLKPVKVQKPPYVRELGPVEISALVRLVGAISERTWAAEDSRKENAFDCFHHTRHVVFRFIRQNRDPRDFYSNPSWDAWKSVLLPIIEKASSSYNFSQPVYPKVMLARLAAGGEIDLHRDGAGSNLRTHKIHVPLITSDSAVFCFEDAEVHLQAGKAYEVNNLRRHGGRNNGGTDRVHLIFEVFDAAMAEAARDEAVRVDA